MDAAPHSAQSPTWLLWLSAHGLLGALWQSLIDFTQNFQCLQVSACDLLALGLLLQSLHAKQNKIIRRLSLIFLNLQENFSWAQICCQMIFLLTCLFYSDKSSGSKRWKIIFKLTRKWGGDGWVTAEIFTNLKGFLYLAGGKKKKLDFKAVRRKMWNFNEFLYSVSKHSSQESSKNEWDWLKHQILPVINLEFFVFMSILKPWAFLKMMMARKRLRKNWRIFYVWGKCIMWKRSIKLQSSIKLSII